MKVRHVGERHNLCWGAVVFAVLCLVVTLLAGCERGEQPLEGGDVVLTVSSSAFQE